MRDDELRIVEDESRRRWEKTSSGEEGKKIRRDDEGKAESLKGKQEIDWLRKLNEVIRKTQTLRRNG